MLKRQGGLRHCVLAIGLVLAGITVAGTASGQPTNRDTAKQQLQEGEARLRQATRQGQQIESNVQALSRQHEEINTRLIETGSLIQGAEERMTAIEDHLGKLNEQKDAASKRLVTSYTSISTMLAAMQRMGRDPPPVIVTRRKDALEMVRSAMMMARAFPHLRSEAEKLAGELKEIEGLIASIRKQRDDLGAETLKLTGAQAELKSLLEVKKQTVAEQQQRLDEVRRESTEISRKVQSMSELISRLDDTVAAKTGIGEYERRERSQDVVAAVPPSLNQPGPAVQYKPQSTVFKAKPGRLQPAIPFHLAKGQLPLPAVGRRVVGFKDRTELGSRSEGIVLETRHGAQITSPCDGWIVYAGVFRSYGQLLIINAGDGYHVLLAGLSTIDVQVGQFVLASEPVGTMDVKRKGKPQDNAPILSVEFRKDGRPIDPEPWWLKDLRKVQG